MIGDIIGSVVTQMLGERVPTRVAGWICAALVVAILAVCVWIVVAALT